jgi:hypothetical protein
MNATCYVFQRLILDGESLMSKLVHKKLGDKMHEHALCCMKSKFRMKHKLFCCETKTLYHG